MASPPKAKRLESVDLLRGIVMIIMALDHTRDFVSRSRFDPSDLDLTTPALFFTRWITHYCAPVFVFLAGTGAYLSASAGKPRAALSRFLLTRGLWMLVLEVTLVRLGWVLSYDMPFYGMQVIWVLGWCMIVLAGLVWLPIPVIAVFGASLVCLHNLFDGIQGTSLGAARPLWVFLHEGGVITLPAAKIFIRYPLVPWAGVMALGYAFGRLLEGDAAKRRRRLVVLGASLTVAFVVVRGLALYGDPHPWAPQGSTMRSLMAFLACEKYPPSLAYLLMTLGPSILSLAALERWTGPSREPFLVFGRVPLFYYLLHLPLLHLAGVAIAAVQFGRFVPQLLDAPFGNTYPVGYGLGLPGVYLVWAVAVIGLYPVCRWFAGVKRSRRDPWLSYL